MYLNIEHRDAVKRMRTAMRYLRYSENHPGKATARAVQWCKDNRVRFNEGQRARYHRDISQKSVPYFATEQRKAEKRRRKAAGRAELHGPIMSRAIIQARWNRRNPHKRAQIQRQRYARKLGATPSWADKKAIDMIYAEAASLTRRTGIQHEVDHIVPIKHDLVCGLHVEYNLQILTRRENAMKNNKFIPGE